MNMYDIIDKKRQKQNLSKEEIEYFVKGFTEGKIPDYQASSLLMAICCNGMDTQELTNLTIAMADSGDKLDLSPVNGVTVDKHSTGGVGDKTTLIVAPIVASLGCKVAKMSGRALGFTGGTIDKLESIDGYNTNVPEEDFIDQVNKIGIGLIGSSKNLAPADKKIYALRDVTATVQSIPLIASSIMSKKIAAGSECIVLDVKVGSGAFMKNFIQGAKLARTMVNIGKMAGRKMSAVITNMNAPLGNQIGNNLEVKEAIEVLKGKGPKDLTDLCINLSTEMLRVCTNKKKDECEELVKRAITDGLAFNKFKELVANQGGSIEQIDNPDLFEKAKYSVEIKAPRLGHIIKMNTSEIGRVSCILGAGRDTKEDNIDYSAGITIIKKTGDFVKKGETLAILHTNKEDKIEEAKELYLSSLKIYIQKPARGRIVYGVIN